MRKEDFTTLCKKIKDAVGEETFKLEVFLKSCTSCKTDVASNFHGGKLPGELKIAMMLTRMLAGASYLDLLDTYDVYYMTVFRRFHECIGWVLTTFWFPLHFLLADTNEVGLNNIACGFARFTQGILRKIIGVIDGLVIQIHCPSPTCDGIADVGNYFCQKGFYALNVQAICDSYKQFLWASPGHKGTSHDSSAWYETNLHMQMKEMAPWLEEKGYILLGDSAYNLLSYFLVPFDDTAPGSAQDGFSSAQDGFNFWFSSNS